MKEVDLEKACSELKEKDESLNFMRSVEEEEGSGKAFVVKDSICARGTVTSAGSKMLEDYRPVFDATVVKRMENEGFSLLGKTQMDEFGFGTFSTNCAFGTPRNPHDHERVVGGSSGGAAAAVAAADFPLASLGESTGGSITNPAAYNGVYGLTPTYGRVSRHGLISYANSLDKIGVLASNLETVREAFQIIEGPDKHDSTTQEAETVGDVQRIGVPEEMLQGVDEGVMENFEASLEALGESFEVERVSEPRVDPEKALPAYYITAMAEASTNLARYSGMRYGFEKDPEAFEDYNDYFESVRTDGFGEEAKRRILIGTYIRSEGYRDQYYVKAAKVRRKVVNGFKSLFEEYDALAVPSMPNIAPKIEEAEEMRPEEVYAMDSLTVGPNLAGTPQLSVPNGESQGMPTGLQLIGPRFSEEALLSVAEYLKE